MQKLFFNKMPFIGLALTVLFASAGFMTVIESRCAMMEDSNAESCPMMSCCEAPTPDIDHGLSYTSPLKCHTLTLAGLPSTLLSTSAREQNDTKIFFTHHDYVSLNTPSEIGNPKSAIINTSIYTPRPPSVERYILISAFLI